MDFPWTAEFDENFTCWKLIDADGDGSNWAKFPTSIASLGTGPSAANLDNWLVSPAIHVNQRLKAKISTRCYRMPSAGVYILRVNGFKPRKVMVMG